MLKPVNGDRRDIRVPLGQGLGADCKVTEGCWPISGVMQVALHVDCGLMFLVVTTL